MRAAYIISDWRHNQIGNLFPIWSQSEVWGTEPLIQEIWFWCVSMKMNFKEIHIINSVSNSVRLSARFQTPPRLLKLEVWKFPWLCRMFLGVLWSIFEKSKFYTFLVMGQKVKQGWDRLLPSMFNEKSVVSFTNDFQSYKLNYFTVLAIKSQILAKNIFGSVIIYFWKVCYFYFLSYYFLSEHKSISSAISPF